MLRYFSFVSVYFHKFISIFKAMNEFEASDVHSPLGAFLTDYFCQHSPGYAVLVTGPWGIGKTHQVKRCLNKKYIFVSLAGVKTDLDVHNSVIFAHKPSRKIWTIIVSYVKKIFTSSAIANAILLVPSVALVFMRDTISKDHTIVFDDLERCKLDCEDVLGIVSNYIDIHGLRVVLIADYDKLIEKYQQFPTVMERVVGRMIQLEPQVDCAFSSFISHFPKRELAVIEAFKKEILQLFHESETSSLRVLRQLLWGLSKLISILDNDILEHKDALTEVVCLYCVFEIELKIGFLSPSNLLNRTEVVESYLSEKYSEEGTTDEIPKILEVHYKYNSVSVLSTTLSDNALQEIFVLRRYNKSVIIESVKRSWHFLHYGKPFPWRILANFTNYSDSVLLDAVQQMESRFENRDIVIFGEMLHLFSLRMLYSEAGMINIGFEALVSQCKCYVDDIRNDGRMQLSEEELVERKENEGGYGGLGYYVLESYETYFNDVKYYLKESRKVARRQHFDDLGRKILNIIANNAKDLRQEYLTVTDTYRWYIQMAAFTTIDPVCFVRTWLGTPKSSWITILYSLTELFSKDESQSPQHSDVRWLRHIVEELENCRNEVRGMDVVRIGQLISSLQVRLYWHEG